MAQDDVTYGGSKQVIPVDLQSKAMDLESGVLGKVFGNHKTAPTNIAGAVIILLVVPGVLLVFFPGVFAAPEYWKVITPILTLVLGYLFGKN